MEVLERANHPMGKINHEVVERNHTKARAIATYYVCFVTYSFIGWIWETIVTSIDVGSLQKRGFLDLPLLPIYGTAITIILFLFYNRGYSMLKILYGSMLITTVQEFITSWLLEKLFHQVWWDYSHMRFQVQGRVCLLATITFGVASLFIVQYIHPKIDKKIQRFIEYPRCKKLCKVSFFIILSNILFKVIHFIS